MKIVQFFKTYFAIISICVSATWACSFYVYNNDKKIESIQPALKADFDSKLDKVLENQKVYSQNYKDISEALDKFKEQSTANDKILNKKIDDIAVKVLTRDELRMYLTPLITSNLKKNGSIQLVTQRTQQEESTLSNSEEINSKQ